MPNLKGNKGISIIVPTLNEEGNIIDLIKRLDQVLGGMQMDYEIIFIDDHSTDKTKEIITEFSENYPVFLYLKKGKRGKAYSIQEGLDYARYSYIAFIDADLQYPPEAIPRMLDKIQHGHDIVIVNRRTNETNFFRRFLHWGFAFFFTRFLHGFSIDVQAGLKMFKQRVAKDVKINPSGWTFDLEFLLKARHYGYKIGSVDITFTERVAGESKINFLNQIFEIGWNSICQKFKKRLPLLIHPKSNDTMIGAGIAHKRQRFVTHTTLPKEISAMHTFSLWQSIFIITVLAVMLIGLIINPLVTGILFFGILNLIYFFDMAFNLFLVIRSLKKPPEMNFSKAELKELDDNELPVYSILCPLYKEAAVLVNFLSAIDKLDWPKDKLDVMLLLEEDDQETINAAEFIGLPDYVRTIIVPHSNPKTKPKACNYGLSMVRGEYVVIYDAEDEPDPAQLKKAYQGFLFSPADIRCLQAKLNYYNANQNLLTRLFTAEYSLWFDVVLPGLQTISTSIPLGGTSNHFRTVDLLELEGWDPFNVTEDCDLGVRIFKRGYKTAIIDSVTLEEANSQVMNWLKQRSRWIKGYMQTYLVHMRRPFKFVKENGVHALIFQLIVGGKVAFMIINPFLWLTTVAYFTFYSLVGPGIEALYPPIIFYIAVTSLIVGNFLYVYYYMIGCARRGHWGLIKYVFFIPVYWLMVSVAAVIAAYQLLVKPHYWEKTQHGLHIKAPVPAPSSGFFPELLPLGSRQLVFAPAVSTDNSAKAEFRLGKASAKIFARTKNYFRRLFTWLNNDPIERFKIAIQRAKPEQAPQSVAGSGPIKKAIDKLVGLTKSEESFFVAALILANFINFLFSAYLGRVLDFENLGLITFINTLWYMAMVFIVALGTTINHQAAYLSGAKGKNTSVAFFLNITRKALKVVLAFSLLWIISTPLLAGFFNIPSYWVLLLITPIFPFGIILYSNFNFLKGIFRFRKAALAMVLEASIKLLLTIVLVYLGMKELVFTVIPVSIFLVSVWTIYAVRKHLPGQIPKQKFVFPRKFFTSSFMAGMSAIAFLSLDIILAKHFLSPHAAGEYALLSLIGKMIYFGGALPNQFMMSFVSRNEGLGKSSQIIFRRIFVITLFLVSSGIVVLGFFGAVTAPILFGDKIKAVGSYLLVYTTAIALFTLTNVIVSFQLARKRYYFTKVSLLFSLAMAAGIIYSHATIDDIVFVITAVSVGAFFTVSALHLIDEYTMIARKNIKEFFSSLFDPGSANLLPNRDLKKILIFNWRDTRHAFAGGAELYIQEMAKRWVSQGTEVTIFCGNDGKSIRRETIDGVNIIRRGGFCLVYAWAFIYYFLFFRGKYDVIIDCQNGVPFFTPLYVKEPVHCLMHHVHQEVFRKSLIKPLAALAMFLERDLMPLVYKNVPFVTVSESSKKEMERLGLGQAGISVIHPGVDLEVLRPGKKYRDPLIVYLGRLQEYKSIDKLIRAFVAVVRERPKAKLVIAGSGEEENKLKQLSRELNLEASVFIVGRISEAKKFTLLKKAWVAVNPSMMEGWGITTIEANACGTPVIASNVPGLRDSVVDRHTGYLFEYGNIEKLSAKIMELITDNAKREAMSNYASAWAKKYDWHYSSLQFFSRMDYYNNLEIYNKQPKHRFIPIWKKGLAQIRGIMPFF